MSLVAFDTLRARHPDLRTLVDGLENQLVSILRKDPSAVIDDRILSGRMKLPGEQEEEDLALLLTDLVAHDALVTRVFWSCPNGYGTSAEAATIPEFPQVLECDRCGQTHEFNADHLDVLFLPAASLLTDIQVDARGSHS
jgi:hypothetical protein